MKKIQVGIVGYGNIGRGVELALSKTADMELVQIFSRRGQIATVLGKSDDVCNIKNYIGKIDVLILCGGSATDLPTQGAEYLRYFNTVDSFDTHARIPEYFAKMDAVGKQHNKLGIISVGWDPGMFSLARMFFGAVLPEGNDYTFWGKGVSQGHSDAIRRIEGVSGAIQYTVPLKEALDSVRNGENPQLTTRQKHKRVCYVVAKEGADKDKIKNAIVTMPNYFADYDTEVNFISEEELKLNHSKMPHGGMVFRTGKTDEFNSHILELSIKLDSNPQFTSSILTCYARAITKLASQGKTGCVTVLDVPFAMLSPKTPEELRKTIL